MLVLPHFSEGWTSIASEMRAVARACRVSFLASETRAALLLLPRQLVFSSGVNFIIPELDRLPCAEVLLASSHSPIRGMRKLRFSLSRLVMSVFRKWNGSV